MDRFAFAKKWLEVPKDDIFEMSDRELLTKVANMMDWSEYDTFQLAKKEVEEIFSYDSFWKTDILTPKIRHELRRAHGMLEDEAQQIKKKPNKILALFNRL